MKTAAVALLFSVSCAVMLSSADAAANVFFIHTDHLDTPRVVSDLAGNKVWIADYDAFGKATITSNTLAPYTSAMNVRFPGQYFDAETSTHYNYFRDYDPLIGRYLQSDPIGLEGGINTYAYAENNPLRYADPLGLRGLTGQEKHLLEPYIPQRLGQCRYPCWVDAFLRTPVGEWNYAGQRYLLSQSRQEILYT